MRAPLEGSPLDATISPIVAFPSMASNIFLSAALMGLGWNIREADTAVSALGPVADEQLTTNGRVDVAVLLRQALQMLGRS